MDRPLRVSVITAILVLLLVSAGTGAAAASPAPTTPIDSGPDDGEGDDRVRPTEQVPFGVETVYGNGSVDRPTGGDSVAVAVIDTGVDRDHPDLENRVTLCRDFTGDRVRCRDRDSIGVTGPETPAPCPATWAHGAVGRTPAR